ncbi:hypothetical protein [Frankia canadensis]|uniref:hypothetical protein n=1 Tax=Frankia canadensis TaxID=1836972 RepID=UPI001FAEB430|nr:hypothetical protein [Frankia canadensis]
MVAEGRNRERAGDEPPEAGGRRPAAGFGPSGPPTGGGRIVAFGTLPALPPSGQAPRADRRPAVGPEPGRAAAFDPADMETDPAPERRQPPRERRPPAGGRPAGAAAAGPRQTFRAVAFGNPTAGGAEVIAVDPADDPADDPAGPAHEAAGGTPPAGPRAGFAAPAAWPSDPDAHPASARYTDDRGVPAPARSAPTGFPGDGPPAGSGFRQPDTADPRAFRNGGQEPASGASSARRDPQRPGDRPRRPASPARKPRPAGHEAGTAGSGPLEKVSTTGVRPALPGVGPPPPGGPGRSAGRPALDDVSFTGRQAPVRLDGPPPRAPGVSRPGGDPAASAGRWDDPPPAVGRWDDHPPAAGQDGPGVRRDRRGQGARRGRGGVLAVLRAAIVVSVIVVGVSIGRTLALPGDAGVLTRLADWGRANHLSFLVDRVDRVDRGH